MKKTKQIGVCFCIIIMLFSALQLPVYAARSKQDVQADIEVKKTLLSGLEKKITEGENDKQVAEKALQEYEVQYNELLGLLDEQEKAVKNTEEQLAVKTQELANTIEDLQQKKALFEDRLLAIYHVNTSNGLLKAALGVNSLTQMLQMADTLQRVTKNDTDLLTELDKQKQKYETQKTEMEQTVADLNTALTQLQKNRDWCNGKMREMKNKIALASQQIDEGQDGKQRTQEEINALQAEYNKILTVAAATGSQKGDGTPRPSGSLVWPVPGGRFTSGYGSPRANTGWHYGVDFAAPEGTPIVAAASGRVQTAATHYSYGNYIILDNQDGMRTLYAHCSALAVSAGQTVEAGQVIAYVGNTGDSYGAHLHFEVHENGQRVNPMASGYLNP